MIASMIREETSLTGKGQIQLPAKIRKAIGAEIGDTFLFELTDQKEIRVKLVKKIKLLDLAGTFPMKKVFPGIEKEEELTKKKVSRKIAQNE